MSVNLLPTPPIDRPLTTRPWYDRLAPVMVALAFLYLVAVAGVIHRAIEPTVTVVELRAMGLILVVLWPIFVVEAVAGVFARSRTVPLGPAIFRCLLVALFPPARMGLIHPATGQIWLPRFGWQSPGKGLLKRLDQATGGLMLGFAVLVVPLLGLQFAAAEAVNESPVLQFAVDIATAVIWVAFATEFIVKSSAAPTFVGYLRVRWLDAAIVLLPTLEVVLASWAGAGPLLRLFRLNSVLSPQYLSRMGRLYRLRGLLTKGWQAVLVIEGFARLMGQTPEKRLVGLEAQIAEVEETLANLRAEADAIRKTIQPTE